MLAGIKRTKNNDLVINRKGLSVLNILFITSVLVTLFYFIPLFGGDESFSLFRIATASKKDLDSIVGVRGYALLSFIYPIVNIILWVLNKKATGNKSYVYVNIIYILTVSFGFMQFVIVNLLSGFIFVWDGDVSIFTWLLLLILLINLILAVFGILRTGAMEIDENAVAMDLNVDYAKGVLNKAGNMATAVAGNVSAAASKVTSSNTVTCDKCGAVCAESSGFCTKCGNNLENAKRMKAASKIANSNTVVCDKCGSECADTSTFCTKCGNNLDNAKRAKFQAMNQSQVNTASFTPSVDTRPTFTAVDETAKIAGEIASNTTESITVTESTGSDTKVNLEKPESSNADNTDLN